VIGPQLLGSNMIADLAGLVAMSPAFAFHPEISALLNFQSVIDFRCAEYRVHLGHIISSVFGVERASD
jgi:hypothetical protein